MRNICIIFKKQLKDTLKNKTILIQFILFPLMTVVMENSIQLEGMAEHFFAKLFSIMYIGMAPLAAVSSIISEEKEKNTLRVLIMANVKPWQYLMGIGLYVWSICMLGAGVIGLATAFNHEQFIFFMSVMGLGFMISILAGATVGILAHNQMMATSVVMPMMMVLSFLPMISMFNEKVEKVAKITYTGQLREILYNMSWDLILNNSIVVIGINAICFLALFTIAYRKNGLE